MRTLGLAVVGMGWMGELHTRALLRLPHHYPDIDARVVPVVVADPRDDRRRAGAEQYGFTRSDAEWRNAIVDPAVDIVSITAPNAMHAEVVAAAVAAGKPFWVEKPVGRTPQDAIAAASAARRAGVMSAVGFDYELVPAVLRAKELVDDGTVGPIRTYRGRFLADYAASPTVGRSWRFVRNEAGSGVLGDLMTHVIDQALLLCGPIDELMADEVTFVTERPEPATAMAGHFGKAEGAAIAPVENEDHLSALVRFASGARGTLEVGRCVVGRHVQMGFDLYGAEAALSWTFERMNELEVASSEGIDAGFTTSYAKAGYGDFTRFQPGPGIPMGYDDLKVIEASGFVRSVLSGQPVRPNMTTMAEVAKVMLAMQRSVSSRSWEEVGSLADEGLDEVR
jgi:predicted dehydrogenase